MVWPVDYVAGFAGDLAGGVRNLLAAVCIFAVNLVLNWPLFSPGESPYRQSIELGYAGISRFIAEHPNPW